MQRKIRKLYEKYERYVLIVLVLLVLVIFTVTQDVTDWLRGLGSDQFDPSAIAGAFSVLPGDRTEISYDEYERARQTFRRTNSFFTGGRDRTQPSEVWTHLVLRAAAEKEGIGVSNSDLKLFLKRTIPPEIWNDPVRYKDFVSNRLGTNPRQFEEGVREFLTALRVRDIYRQSFEVAPPATREAMVNQYSGRDDEHARVTWLALDAKRYIEAASKDLETNVDADKELGQFFSNDAAVKTDPFKFRHKTRYLAEYLVIPHKPLMDPDNMKRIEDLFSKTWPELDMGKLDPKPEDMRDYFGIYRDRLLALHDTDWAKIKAPTDVPPGEEESEEESKGDEEKQPGDEPQDDEKKDDEPQDDEKKDDEPQDDEKKEPTAEEKQAWFNRGFDIVRDQVMREVHVRGMMWQIRDTAGEAEDKSLKVIFDRLVKNDDKDNPICSTDPTKGLIILLTPEPMTGAEIESLEVHGERGTHNIRFPVTRIGGAELPEVGKKPEPWGMEGEGRFTLRLVKVEQARRKTFAELSGDEKEQLRTEFYLPHKARERAKAALEELRKQCADGSVTAADLPGRAGELGARYWDDEWVTATSRFMAEPERKLYWPAEYAHMRDRHYLRRALAQQFAADRAKKAIEPGSYLNVVVDSREEDDDPGAAYLVLVLERKKPSAETMPLDEFSSFILQARRQRSTRERERWDRDFPAIKSAFRMEFFGDMQKLVQDELAEREEAKRKQARRN